MLPQSGRLWIFPCLNTLPSPGAALGVELDRLVSEWLCHGSQVVGGWEVRERQFILVGADTSRCEVSGCSIDSLFRTVSEIGARVGFELAPSSDVFWKSGLEVQHNERSQFADLVRTGQITPNTQVFDNTITTLEDLHAGLWIKPFAQSWHARAFPLAA